MTDSQQPPQWTGDLKDDCTARWAGLTLRAEWMNRQNWWWCVYDDATGEQVHSSHDDPQPCLSGHAARTRAEAAARRYLRVE